MSRSDDHILPIKSIISLLPAKHNNKVCHDTCVFVKSISALNCIVLVSEFSTFKVIMELFQAILLEAIID